MNKEISNKEISEIEAKQPKNLNIPKREFSSIVIGKRVKNVDSKGKWIFIRLQPQYYMLINLGMGGDLLYFRKGQRLPDKYHFKLTFNDDSGFTAYFWWFGYIHIVKEDKLSEHKRTAKLGIQPTDREFTLTVFKNIITKKRSRIKNFLLDQKNIVGIGNVYVQDILFRSRLHPNRKIPTLSKEEIENLYNAIKYTLNLGIKLGGLAYEKDFFGEKGKFTSQEFLVGYKEGKPCPTCKTLIEKIKTGSTSTYICPECQKVEKKSLNQ
jgi:formamidopyrimidine-DNA glycosylase